MNDNAKYLQMGKYTQNIPDRLLEQVRKIDNSLIDEEYIKKILRIIAAEFDPDKHDLSTTQDFRKSRYTTASNVLDERLDSCGALATVVATTLRTVHIPTKLIHGYYVANGKSILHAWNEVLLNNIWVPFDIKGKKRGISEFHNKEAELVDWSEMEDDERKYIPNLTP